MIDRGDYWQCAYLVRKGGDAGLRARPVTELQQRFTALLPWLGDRTSALRGWDDVRLLVVALNRLRRWYRDGLLLIGDAAHAMSPVGGVGINLAVQDAVAAARVLAPVLRRGEIPGPAVLRRIQLRRWWPTVAIQAGQRVAHRLVIRPTLAAPPTAHPRPGPRIPLGLRVLGRFSALQGLPARLIAIGPLPEHAPAWARRTGPASARPALGDPAPPT